jgi:hypothetical protein
MSEKHKSKYKAPKDLEKSQKSKPRKDLKDYTMDDKKGGMNPKSTGDKQLNVLRKTDKEMVDTGDMYVKYNADDRLYKDIEDGYWDPKTAAKRLKKRQDTEEKETADVLQDKIENLTREQKERVVREYIRRKITRILSEQAETEDAPEDTAAPEEAPEPTDAAATDPAATDVPGDAPEGEVAPEAPLDDMGMAPMSAPSMSMPSAPAADIPMTPTDTSATGTETGATELTSDEIENRAITTAAAELEKEGSIGKIKAISKILKISMKDYEIEDQATVYRMLRQFAIKKLNSLK